MFSELAMKWGIDAGIIALAIFCIFWVLLGLGGAILALSVRWPFQKGGHKTNEKDPGLAQNNHFHPRH